MLALVLDRSNHARARQNSQERQPLAPETSNHRVSLDTTGSYFDSTAGSAEGLAEPPVEPPVEPTAEPVAEPVAHGDADAQPSDLPDRTVTSPSPAIDANGESLNGKAADAGQQPVVTLSAEESIPFLLVDDNPINLKVWLSPAYDIGLDRVRDR